MSQSSLVLATHITGTMFDSCYCHLSCASCTWWPLLASPSCSLHFSTLSPRIETFRWMVVLCRQHSHHLWSTLANRTWQSHLRKPWGDFFCCQSFFFLWLSIKKSCKLTLQAVEFQSPKLSLLSLTKMTAFQPFFDLSWDWHSHNVQKYIKLSTQCRERRIFIVEQELEKKNIL